MSTTITFSTDEELKNQASKLFDSLGMDLTVALNLFMKQAVLKQKYPCSLEIELVKNAKPTYPDSSPAIKTHFLKIPSQSIVIPAVVMAEIEYGAMKSYIMKRRLSSIKCLLMYLKKFLSQRKLVIITEK